MHEDGSVTLKLTIYFFRDSAVARMAFFLQLLADSCIIFFFSFILRQAFLSRRTGCFILILPSELSRTTTERPLVSCAVTIHLLHCM